MLHVVCACGHLVGVMPGAAGSEVPCRACGAAVRVPPRQVVASVVPASGMVAGGISPPGAAGTPRALPSPAPSPGAGSGGGAEARAGIPVGPGPGTDLRLDLTDLDRRARQAAGLATVALWTGVFGAAALLTLLPARAPARALAAVGLLLAAVLLYGAFRVARAAALAAIALAERQREMAHRLGR